MTKPHQVEDICPECNGTGFIAKHDLPTRHGEDGECVNCPIKAQCEECEGIGRILFTEVGKFK